MLHIKRKIVGICISLLLPCYVQAGKVSDLFKLTSPSVVVLYTFESSPKGVKNGEEVFTSNKGLGSGVLISKDGVILTASHVVNLSDSVHVEFSNGKKLIGKVISSDRVADIAMLKVEHIPEGITPSLLADSDKVLVGDDVYVIGAPYGLGQTLTVGYLSGKHEKKHSLSSFRKVELFQTDAAINTGNSGGPMFNEQGKVIGIVSHILSKSGGFEGLGFAVTSNTVRDLLIDTKAFWAGAEWKIVTDHMARALNLPPKSGLLVERVAKGSPSDKAGLKGGVINTNIGDTELVLGGDIIISVNGINIAGKPSLEKIYESIRSTKNSSKIILEIYRGGKKQKLTIKN